MNDPRLTPILQACLSRIQVGVVEAVEDGVAHDILVVGEHRIPFVRAIVPVVDVEARRMVLVDGFTPEAVE